MDITIKLTDNGAEIKYDNNTITLAFAIDGRDVTVNGFAMTPGWVSVEFTARAYQSWEADAQQMYDENRSNRDLILTIVSVALLAVDQWATAERFAQARVTAAEAAAQNARAASDRAAAELAEAEDALAKARAGK